MKLHRNYVILEQSNSTCDEKIDNRCYYISSVPKTWVNAAHDCIKIGGTLVDKDMDDLELLNLKPTSFWIGLTRVSQTWKTGLSLEVLYIMTSKCDHIRSLNLVNNFKSLDPSGRL